MSPPSCIFFLFVEMADVRSRPYSARVQRNKAVKPGVLFQSTGGAVACLGLCRAQYLLQRFPPHNFPDPFQVLGQGNLMPFCRLHDWSTGCRFPTLARRRRKTRSAPRIRLQLCNRCIQSPTRTGNSRSTSAHSPTGAFLGRGRQMRWTLVAKDAVSRAFSRDPISVEIGHDPVIVQPPRIIPESRASHPSVVLWAKTMEPIPSLFRTRLPSEKARAMASS